MSTKKGLLSLFGWKKSTPPEDKKGDEFIGNKTPWESYTKGLQVVYERRRRYDIYDELDEISIVSSVLDAYAEDATQQSREKGKAVWVETPSKRAKDIIDNLFERLKVEEYVEAISRDVAQRGDDFAVLNIEKDNIAGWDWADPRDIERVETIKGILAGFDRTDKVNDIASSVKAGNKVKLTYKPWEVIHFRLYKRKRNPKKKYRNLYGTSLLEGSQRIARQVKILDDMLMVRRLVKSLDTRIYKVDTGRSHVSEQVKIIKRWKNALKSKPYVDPAGGRLDKPFDPFTWQTDIFWPQRTDSQSSVDVIQGSGNVSDIVDVDHFVDQLFGSLRAPKGYFGFEGDINAKATLASQDMKWGRSVNSLQKAVRNGLTRLAQIELALHDVDPFTKFSIKMVTPSVLEDLSRLEALQTTVDVADRMASLGDSMNLDPASWHAHILQTVLGFTKSEISKFTTSSNNESTVIDPAQLDEIVSKLIMSQSVRSSLSAEATERAAREELPNFESKETSEDSEPNS